MKRHPGGEVREVAMKPPTVMPVSRPNPRPRPLDIPQSRRSDILSRPPPARKEVEERVVRHATWAPRSSRRRVFLGGH
jgi:hypothetical protein